MTLRWKTTGVGLRLVEAFARRRNGGVTEEFAALVTLFIGLIFTIAQIGLYFYYSASLYYVTHAAARQILTGGVANQNLTAAQFKSQILCPLLPGSMSCGNIVTNIQIVQEGAQPQGFYALMNYTQNAGNPLGYTMTGLAPVPMDNTKTSYCIGSAGSIVAVEVYYAMPVLGIPSFLGVASTFNGQSVIFINATAAFKNEPFTTSYTGC